MTKDEIKIANMHERLEQLKEACLRLHDDSITYQVCEVLQEFIHYVAAKNEHEL